MKSLGILGVIIFILGLIIGLAFLGFTMWADFESTLFSAAESGEARLTSLRCPVVINQTETGLIKAKVTNTLDRMATQRVDAYISDGFVTLIRTHRDLFKLDPGDSRSLEWEISSEDAAFNIVVLARIFAKGGYPSPDRQGTCGVLVVPTSTLSGNLITIATIASSIILQMAGLGLWNWSNRPLKGKSLRAFQAMVVLTTFIAAGMVTSIMGWWLIGALIFMVSILLIGGIIAYFITA